MRFWRKRKHPETDTPPGGTAGGSARTTGSKPPLYLGRSKANGGDINFTGEGSLLTVGPPGTGKSRGVAVWNLLRYPGSMLVTDPKGQLVQWSAAVRRDQHGQNIAVLDPFGLTGWPTASVNPLAALADAVARGEGYRTEASRIAHMLLPDLPGDKDPFWRAGARDLLMAGLLFLAALRPDECDLPGLHDLLWLGEKEFLDSVIDPMQEHGGALRQYAQDIEDTIATQERAYGYFRKEARQALSIFAPDEPCGRVCRRSDIDLAELIAGRLTVYLVLPPELVASHGRWMGLVTAQAVHAVMQARQNGECVFLLDEFPNLGRLPGIRDAIAQLREKGLRCWLFVQDLAQLEAVYGRADAEAMRYQAEVIQVLGCRSPELARYIEARAGTVTVKDESFSLGDPLDEERAPHVSVRDAAKPVLSAAEALNMPHGEQILIRAGFPVILADVVLWRGG